MRIQPILAEISIDVTWKISGSETCTHVAGQVRVKTDSAVYSVEILFVPRQCFGRLKCHNFKDAADWNAVSNVAVMTDNCVRFEQRVND